MRPMAQMAMVMNLDKCIGCHTCSVTCKQAWTNRSGVEYAWFNNVETRPGLGYPRTYQDQDRWRGGWTLNRRGRLTLRAGGRIAKLLNIFANPLMPSISDYYEPWTYDYENLIAAPPQQDSPVARPKSLISGKDMKVSWSANWDDDLAGGPALAAGDPVLARVCSDVRMEFERTFMFYLPRICEHCLNPACAASCPSGAIYKRTEDGIVLVDQDRCRGWRMCVTGCPYKKVYFNHRTGKAEKCTFCYPRVEVGIPTVCAETCVGRLRYIGLVLYDADRVLAAASAADEQELYAAQREVFLDPADPEVARAAERAGIPHDWVRAAQRSPVWALISRFEVALPLHPEYRTLPMVWYIPPLSPVVDVLRDTGHDAEAAPNLFGAIDALRIPLSYLAGLFTAGDARPVRDVLARLAAMRSFMRDVNLGREPDVSIPAAVGMSPEDVEDMYRLLALAKYDERYVIPSAHPELADTGLGDVAPRAHQLKELACSLDYEGGPGMGGSGPFGESSGGPPPVAVETFHALRQRQTSDTFVDPADGTERVNLLNWDGKGGSARLCRRAAGWTMPHDPGVRPGHAGRVAGPGLPRRRVAAAPAAAARDRRRGARPGPGRAAGIPGGGGRMPGRGAAAGLRRDVRPAPPVLPVPHVLQLRRHPQARHGPAAVHRRLPDRRIRAGRRRTARSPRRAVRVHRGGAGTGPGPVPQAPGRSRAAPDGPGRRDGAVAARRGRHPRRPARAAPRDLRRALDLARSGPPAEEVGLEPFAPPEYMGGRR